MREKARCFRAWGALALGTLGVLAAGVGRVGAGDREFAAAVGEQPVAWTAPHIVINEVETRGGSPGDWVELYNAGSTRVDLSGYRFKDSDDSHTYYVVPAGTSLAPGAFLVLEESQFGFGLGGADSARLYAPHGDAPIASYAWTAHAAATHGRCSDGQGAFASTQRPTKGAPNDCI